MDQKRSFCVFVLSHAVVVFDRKGGRFTCCIYNIIRIIEEKANKNNSVTSSFEMSFSFISPLENEIGIYFHVNNALSKDFTKTMSRIPTRPQRA